jgi:hypothetical protein
MQVSDELLSAISCVSCCRPKDVALNSDLSFILPFPILTVSSVMKTMENIQ